MKFELTYDLVRELLDYDPSTGLFVWKRRRPEHFRQDAGKSPEHLCARFNAIYPGKLAGRRHPEGYQIITICNRMYGAHRIAFLWMTGTSAENEIDHKNRNKNDNRWSNLRQATRSENRANVGVYKNSSSGARGVQFKRKSKIWIARIQKNKKRVYLGQFDTFEEAVAARNLAVTQYHGEFGCDGVR